MSPAPSLVAALLDDPRLRSATACDLAEGMGADPREASAAIAVAFRALTGHDPPRDPSCSYSIDDLCALIGDPSFVIHPFAGAASMSNPSAVFVLRPSVREGIVALDPSRASDRYFAWLRAGGEAFAKGAAGPLRLTIEHGAAGPSSPGPAMVPPKPGLYRAIQPGGKWSPDWTGEPPAPVASGGTGVSPTYTRWDVVVKEGWTPSELAALFTGDAGRYMELLSANPTVPQIGGPKWVANFTRFQPGDRIHVPLSWYRYMSREGDWGFKGAEYDDGPATVDLGPPPVASPTTGTSYTATLPDGRIAALKGELGAIGVRFPGSAIAPYPGLFDIGDAVDESFRGAVSRFQKWANGMHFADGSPFAGYPALREDGTLDAATAAEIDAYASTAATTPAGTPAYTPTITGGDTSPGWMTGPPGAPATSWPSPIPGLAGPSGPGKTLTPDGSGAPGAIASGIAGPGQPSESSGTVGLLGALALGWLALKGV